MHMQSLVLRNQVRPLSDSPKGPLDGELAMNFKSLFATSHQAVFHSEEGLREGELRLFMEYSVILGAPSKDLEKLRSITCRFFICICKY